MTVARTKPVYGLWYLQNDILCLAITKCTHC